jgi:hypothetical protein
MADVEPSTAIAFDCGLIVFAGVWGLVVVELSGTFEFKLEMETWWLATALAGGLRPR